MNTFKLTRREAEKILTVYRANKDTSVADCFKSLNDNHDNGEILLDSGAKITGYRYHYKLQTYVQDDADGKAALTLIGRGIITD